MLYPKQIIIVSHYNSKQNGKYVNARNNLINLLNSICKKHDIPFINPTIVLSSYKQEQVMTEDLGHYTTLGINEFSKYVNMFVNQFNTNQQQKKIFFKYIMNYQLEYSKLINEYNTNVAIIKNYRIPAYNKQLIIIKLTQNLKTKIQTLKDNYNRFIQQQSQQLQLQQLQQSQQQKCSLSIGINYIGSPYELYGCINDATNVSDILKTKFSYTKSTLLTDKTQVKPTKTNILSAFINLLSGAKSGDNLFFIFSGHGSQIDDVNGDEIDNLDEVIITEDLKDISDDEIKNIINTHLKTGVQLFCIFDSCHSGTCLDLKYNENSVNSSMNDTPSQTIFISGCKDDQTSEDAYINSKNCGALTFSFLETLKKYNYSLGNLTYKQLITDMRQILSNNNFSQIPQLSYGQPMDINQTFVNL
jgi:hypothetical protein